MYSVTKEKSNEKIQKVILYSSLDFKWGYRVLGWGRCQGEFQGYTDLSLRLCARGHANPYIKPKLYGQHIGALNPYPHPSEERLRWYFHINWCPTYWSPIRDNIDWVCLQFMKGFTFAVWNHSLYSVINFLNTLPSSIHMEITVWLRLGKGNDFKIVVYRILYIVYSIIVLWLDRYLTWQNLQQTTLTLSPSLRKEDYLARHMVDIQCVAELALLLIS